MRTLETDLPNRRRFLGFGACFLDTCRYDEGVLGLCKVFMAAISFRLSLPFAFLSSNPRFNLKHFSCDGISPLWV
jgi:hypothetical protein